MHLLTITTPGGEVEHVVLRRYVRPEVIAEEPDIAERETRVLRFVAGFGTPTPQPPACDPTGAQAGVPAVLMSRLPGRVDWSPSDVDRWVARLAGVLPPIHTALPPEPGSLPRFSPYHQDSDQPPAWAQRPSVWSKAVERFHERAPEGPQTLIHRDFHPGNVLWQRGRVTGVVDWQAASVGPPSIDVGNCRLNLLDYGPGVVDRFTGIWERLSGHRYHPWADIVAVIGCLDGLREEPPPLAERLAIEDTLAKALAALNGSPR